MLKYFIFLVLGLSLSACSSTQTASDLEYPLTSIYSAVGSVLSMGIQHASENNRELTYRPFIVKQDPEAKKEGYRDRGVATIAIIGDGRPYTLEVTVDIERGKIPPPKANGKSNLSGPTEYSHDHYDKELARRLLVKILATLDRRQHDDNIIDDFKPF